jgi:signal transduction histidine kinase
MTTRLRWGVTAATVLAGLACVAALLWGGYQMDTQTLGVTMVVTLTVGWSFAGLGILAWVRWPTTLAGRLMVAVGLAWFARTLGAVEHPWAFGAGLLVGSLYLGVLGHLIVTYPSGRLTTGSQRAVVAAGYFCTLPLNFIAHWLMPSSESCRDCPHNLLSMNEPDSAPTDGDQVLYAIVVAVTAAALGVTVRRWHTATPAQRRSLAPALGGATIILIVLALQRLSMVLGAPEQLSLPFSWTVIGVLVLWPLGLVAGLARGRFDRSAVADLVVEFSQTLPPGSMRGALARVLHDPSIEVAFWLPDRNVFVDESGSTVATPTEDGGRAVTLLSRDGEVIAALTHDPVLVDQPGLMSAVAAAAGLAMENDRLHAQARAHLIEIKASRIRIVAAAGAERRRVERNLHDGAQQRMLNLMLALRRAKARLAVSGNNAASNAIEDGLVELTLALAELRELASGIHPAVLTHSGLGTAVRALAQRSSVPVRVTDDLGELRFPEAVEETAYFIVSEALANVAKHAHASHAVVCIRQLDDNVIVDVTDDGVGGASLQGGEGLRGLQDRVDAYSGRLRIDSGAGKGTHILATLPCG